MSCNGKHLGEQRGASRSVEEHKVAKVDAICVKLAERRKWTKNELETKNEFGSAKTSKHSSTALCHVVMAVGVDSFPNASSRLEVQFNVDMYLRAGSARL